MSRIYMQSAGPGSWQALLADPELHWKIGRSARTLAHAWEDAAQHASGLPAEVAALFGSGAELLVAIPEHKTALPGGRRESQSDVFALVRANGRVSAAAIEGKVDETFGPTLGEWLAEASPGKRERLAFICGALGLSEPAGEVRYQLLHRTAAAIVEAGRFGAGEAAMVVHSFSPTRAWFEDYAAFARLFGVAAEPGAAAVVALPSGLSLRLGWAVGDAAFLLR